MKIVNAVVRNAGSNSYKDVSINDSNVKDIEAVASISSVMLTVTLKNGYQIKYYDVASITLKEDEDGHK